jgi:hypothetical protein
MPNESPEVHWARRTWSSSWVRSNRCHWPTRRRIAAFPTACSTFASWDFHRQVALLTLWATALVVVIAAIKADPGLWVGIAGLWFLAVCAVWLAILAVDCLAVIFVAIWRLSKRLTQTAQVETERTNPHGGLWDQWMDGPEPM